MYIIDKFLTLRVVSLLFGQVKARNFHFFSFLDCFVPANGRFSRYERKAGKNRQAYGPHQGSPKSRSHHYRVTFQCHNAYKEFKKWLGPSLTQREPKLQVDLNSLFQSPFIRIVAPFHARDPWHWCRSTWCGSLAIVIQTIKKGGPFGPEVGQGLWWRWQQ